MKKGILLFAGLFITNFLIAMPGGNGGGPCGNPNPPPNCPTIPIDSHVLLLFGLGLTWASYLLFKTFKLHKA